MTNSLLCSECGQDIPMSKETINKFKIMCDLWIKSLLENKK